MTPIRPRVTWPNGRPVRTAVTSSRRQAKIRTTGMIAKTLRKNTTWPTGTSALTQRTSADITREHQRRGDLSRTALTAFMLRQDGGRDDCGHFRTPRMRRGRHRRLAIPRYRAVGAARMSAESFDSARYFGAGGFGPSTGGSDLT